MTTKTTTQLLPSHRGAAKRLARRLAEVALEKKAFDVLIMDLRKLTGVTDFFVLCSADSDTQIKAIVDHIVDEMEKRQQKVWHVEGYENLSWVLLDYVDVVVHVFHKNTRAFYNLENLWGDAKTEVIEDVD